MSPRVRPSTRANYTKLRPLRLGAPEARHKAHEVLETCRETEGKESRDHGNRSKDAESDVLDAQTEGGVSPRRREAGQVPLTGRGEYLVMNTAA